MKEYKERQAEIEIKMESHTKADESFYLTANAVLNLAKRAREIFESSEVDEKRQLLNFLLQNLELDGKKLTFELKTPFDRVLQVSNCTTGLPLQDAFRTIDWGEIRESLSVLSISFYEFAVK